MYTIQLNHSITLISNSDTSDITSDIPPTLPILSTSLLTTPISILTIPMTHYYPITPTSIFSTNLISLFSNSTLIFHYLYVLFHELLRYDTFLDHIMDHSAHVCLLVINPSYFVVIPQFVNCLSTPMIELLCLHLTLQFLCKSPSSKNQLSFIHPKLGTQSIE